MNMKPQFVLLFKLIESIFQLSDNTTAATCASLRDAVVERSAVELD